MHGRSFEDDTFKKEERMLLQTATEQPQADLIADIVGHPDGQPTIEELSYHNPSLSESTISKLLATLKHKDIVIEHTLEQETKQDELPTKCYGLTETARQLFVQENLFPREPWQREYASVEKKSERVQKLERLPRS